MATTERTLESGLLQSRIQNPESKIELPYPPVNYAWYVVGVLTLIYIFSFIDRQILALLVKPIKADLGISDTDVSLLMGPAFVVFYVFFGFIFGRLTDIGNRIFLIAFGFVFWSLATTGGGLANSFTMLLLVRIGVGVGEATLGPAAYSIISDYFPPTRRATAIGVFSMGIYLGSGLAFMLGGLVIAYFSQHGNYFFPLIGEIKPWQMVFFVVGLPGLLLVFLLFTVREPARRDSKIGANGKNTRIPLGEVVVYLNKNRKALLLHNFGFACISVCTYSVGAWIASFFIRLHGWNEAQTGLVLGIVTLTAGPIGILSGGRLADYLAVRGRKDANLLVPFFAILAVMPIGFLYPILNQPTIGNNFSQSTLGILTIIAYIPTAILTSMPFGCAAAAIQQMMPNEMRGQASALYLFINNLLGLGLGPTLVGLMSDKVFGNPNMVHYSMMVVGTVFLSIALVLLRLGRKPYLEAQEIAKEWRAAHAV